MPVGIVVLRVLLVGIAVKASIRREIRLRNIEARLDALEEVEDLNRRFKRRNMVVDV